MLERSIRDLHSSKNIPPLFCKAMVDDDKKVILESKGKGNEVKRIRWEDLVYQVESAIKEASSATK